MKSQSTCRSRPRCRKRQRWRQNPKLRWVALRRPTWWRKCRTRWKRLFGPYSKLRRWPLLKPYRQSRRWSLSLLSPRRLSSRRLRPIRQSPIRLSRRQRTGLMPSR
ncbi:uncharacterized protein PITG_22680 [Phytophthora infestans T30-4]|uniref:Uncharacterized protein n=1 Tax=Phytophthora infestans (strain T30-4) TaxID=403677 RepID=D0MVB0_PHYIT|nr:uncharacterized protein PITG_22680 [Phytophthora infestans T30-4]EEY61106.1 conserved hypothetical protein [Phytophthora infestans T30-4]|eukprot:XP_002908023.1 conserved hypothetical protein [Phytophthora infestans T30-4]